MQRLLLLLLTASVAVQPGGPLPDVTAVRIRSYAHRGVDGTLQARASGTTRELLATASVVSTWRLCVPACDLETGAGPEIVVVLSSSARPGNRHECGTAHPGARAGEGTVIVSMPCVQAVAARLGRGVERRAHPLLATTRYDDLVGAVVAHEIGHLLGLAHGQTGLMRARLDQTDVIALRRGTLAFTPQEAARMRASALSAQVRP